MLKEIKISRKNEKWNVSIISKYILFSSNLWLRSFHYICFHDLFTINFMFLLFTRYPSSINFNIWIILYCFQILFIFPQLSHWKRVESKLINKIFLYKFKNNYLILNLDYQTNIHWFSYIFYLFCSLFHICL